MTTYATKPPATVAAPGATRVTVGKVGKYVLVTVCGLIMAAPLLYLLSASLMSAGDVKAYPPHLLPPTLVWHNYVEAWDFLTVRTVVNSFIFSFGIVSIQLVLTLPAGFALAKIPFRWTALVLGLVIVPQFVPNSLTLIPLYVITHALGLVGTFPGMILPVAGQTAFAMLLFRQSFVSLPSGLIEAARMDGANWVRVLLSVGIPLIKPALAAYCSISFLTAWNLYIWPQVIAPDKDHQVLTVALAPLAQSQYTLIAPGVGLAAAVISMAPVLILFIFLQKWYIKGVVGSGID